MAKFTIYGFATLTGVFKTIRGDRMSRLLAIGLFIFAVYCIYQGFFNYGFWENNTPGGGFLPAIGGIILAIASLNIIIVNNNKHTPITTNVILAILASMIMVFLIEYLGMILILALFMIAWLKLVEKYSLLRSFMYGGTTTIIIYLVFKVALNVPLPEGIFGI